MGPRLSKLSSAYMLLVRAAPAPLLSACLISWCCEALHTGLLYHQAEVLATAVQYIREEEWDAVMCDVPETAVALHLRQRLQVLHDYQIPASLGTSHQKTPPLRPSTVSTRTTHAALQAEEAERARLRREREEAHRYTFIRVATIGDMKAQVGSDVFFDLVDVSKVRQRGRQHHGVLQADVVT